jgi:peptidyl-prolyl cis-trans isomerase C
VVGISVNSVEITDAQIERELPFHQDADSPVQSAARALVLREVLLQEAHNRGLDVGTDMAALEEMDGDSAREIQDDALISLLIERNVKVPVPTEAECENFYHKNPDYFRSGDLVEARHILFQVTPNVPLELLREKAQEILQQVLEDDSRFDALARSYSNCPSASEGGHLGQLGRGQTVPEFETAVFALKNGEVLPRLLETRFGLHIVKVERRVDGEELPFEAVKGKIAEYLSQYVYRKAVDQYLHILVGQARIEGIEIEGAETPLVQ